jgi:hypothetical protein
VGTVQGGTRDRESEPSLGSLDHYQSGAMGRGAIGATWSKIPQNPASRIQDGLDEQVPFRDLQGVGMA